MNQLTLVLPRTPARRAFKELLGHANHFIITILVGLESVKSGTAKRPPEFSTSWSPHNAPRSADRSREFALRSALISTCDAMDMYLRMLNRRPFVLNDPDLTNELNGFGRERLSDRIATLAARQDGAIAVPAMVSRFAVCWRNSLVHYVSDGAIEVGLRQSLLDHKDEIAAQFQSLSVVDMVQRFDRSNGRTSPSFKEATSFIRSAHKYVEIVDGEIVQNLDPDRYFRQWLREFMKDRDDRIVGLWGKDPQKIRSRMVRLAHEAGFTEVIDDGKLQPLSLDKFRDLCGFSVKEARLEMTREEM